MCQPGWQWVICCCSVLAIGGETAREQASLRPGAAVPGSLRELLDIASIPQHKPWRSYQASGYDRGGGYYDSGNFLRVEDQRRYVLMQAEGPGCIDRMYPVAAGRLARASGAAALVSADEETFGGELGV